MIIIRSFACEVNDYLEKSVSILGLGYVGITLAAHMLSRNFSVMGVDPDKTLIKNLKARMHVSEKVWTSLLLTVLRREILIYMKILCHRVPMLLQSVLSKQET